MATDSQDTVAIETHLSRVFLTTDRAYKMLKPVRTSFVDFSDRQIRLDATTEEFELNSRISPEVYLGLADVVEQGETVERMIVMDRLPNDRQLDRLVDDPQFLDHLRDVARLIATFHAGQPPVSDTDAGFASAEALARNWDDSFEVLAPIVGSVIPQEEFRRARHLVDRYIAGRLTLLAERIEQGMVRDGHGDLRCEHAFCLEDGPRLIDCLAFRHDLRIVDVLNDVAFMAMDIHRLAGPAAARWFVAHYGEFADEHHPSSLAHHYVAYRAYVRAKVAAVRLAQGDGNARQEILDYHRLALEHLEIGQPRLVLVGGGAGVGKSTVAGGLADRLAVTWLRSDEIRKEMAGIDHDQHQFSDPDSGVYSPEFTDAVYVEMLRQAELLLLRGESVVLDASWSREQHRNLARNLASESYSSLTELHCVAPQAVAVERIARRMASLYNPSDATPEIAAHIAARFEDWPGSDNVDTNQTVAQSIDDAYCRLMNDSVVSDGNDPAVRVDQVRLTRETIGFFVSRMTRVPAVVLPTETNR